MKNIKSIAFVLSALVVSAIVGCAVLAWTEPGSPAPSGNVAAPVNTGNNVQTKTGGLNVSGNVGIGTTNPTQKLDVVGTAAVKYLRINPQDATNEGGELQLGGSGSYGTFQIDNYQGNARIFTLATGKQLQVLGGSIYADGSASNYLAGNLGIGTTNPSQKLDVAGYVKGQTGICIGSDCRTSWPGTGKDQKCGDSQFVKEIKADGTIVCATGGGGTSCKANGLSCVNNTDCCTALCYMGVCTDGGPGILPRSACKNTLSAGNKRSFVTRAAFNASQIPNEATADQRCRDAAQGAGMSNYGNFQALVYLGQRDINQVMTTYALYNGKKITGTDQCDWYRISNGGNDIFSIGTGTASATNKGANNYLWSPIKYDENGIEVNNGLVWTGFRPNTSLNGSYQLLNTSYVSSPCNGWYASCNFNSGTWPCVLCQSYSPGSMGGAYLSCDYAFHWYGSTNEKNGNWSSIVGVNTSSALNQCKASSHELYCIER